ncbi:MAG: PspA/IM30 family protein [Pseudomonadales bacterium]
MSIFNRMSDIINSNINAMLDHAEDPEKMLKQITREMEETLVDVRTQSTSHIASRRRIEARISRLDAESRHWDRRAELAVDRGRDDLAKAALREKCCIDETVGQLESDLQAIDDLVDKLKADTTALEEKVDYARARRKTLLMHGQTAQSRLKVKRQLHNVSWENALARFEGYERKLDDMEGMVESFEAGNKTLAEEIRELEQEARLDTELQALKDRMNARVS